jgi:hypothetical protein
MEKAEFRINRSGNEEILPHINHPGVNSFYS